MRIFILSLAIYSLIAGLLLTSCNNTSSISIGQGGDTITTTAQLLKIIDYENYTIAEVKNPWNTSEILQRYILVNRNSNVDKSSFPKGVIIKTPIQSSVVYSSVHANAINELGVIDAITGICDAKYYKIQQIKDRMLSGDVIDIGSSMSPSIEHIIELSPEAILTSPFQNAGHGAIEQLKIPIIECADYMETTPLGRAEWIILLGTLYGKRQLACNIYDIVCQTYNQLKDSIATVTTNRPIVISECVTDGVWYMPGGNSYMARLFYDAGAEYPWKEDKSTGSLQLDFASVYEQAHNADYWLIKTFGRELTLDELKTNYPLHAQMEAFNNGGVYSCNTENTSIFEDFPFHPEKLLREYIYLFHPDFSNNKPLKYYKQVK